MNTSGSTTNYATITYNFILPTYYNRNYWPESEKIYVNVGENKIGILGAETNFEAKTLTGDKKQVGNATYFWSFGDGAVGEGKNTFHQYNFIGEYVAFVEAYANGAKSDAKVYVKIIEPNLEAILKENFGKKFVEIKNNSKDEIDIGNFLIKSFGGEFERTSTLPKKLLILPQKSVILSQEILKFATSTNKIIFAYQNGKEISVSKLESSNTIVDNSYNQILQIPENLNKNSLVQVLTKESFEKLNLNKASSTTQNSFKNYGFLRKKVYAKNKKFLPISKATSTENYSENKFIIKSDEGKNIFSKVFEYFGI